MISIDFTDSLAKIAVGSFKNGSVTVTNAFTVNLTEGMITNGFIVDAPQICAVLREALRANQIKEKEVVVSISSNQIVLKDLSVPKTRGDQFNIMVHNQIKSEMGINDDYNISYTIIGENKNDASKVDVFATACPQRLVDGYVGLFETFGLKLVGVNITSSCITRILGTDPDFEAKMPLLVAQIDKNFININIFAGGQLVFSRYVNVDQTELKLTDNYLEKTTYDNVFRMLQFFNAQHDEQIKNVILYGAVENSEIMIKAIGQLGVDVSVMNQPASVSSFAGFDFNNYANAVGAIFKRNKDTEHINLLESVSAQGSSQSKMFTMILLILVLGSALLIGLTFLYAFISTKSYEKKTEAIETYITEQQPNIDRVTAKEALLVAKQGFRDMAENASSAYASRPVLSREAFSQIENCLNGKGKIISVSYTDSDLTISIEATSRINASNFAEDLNKTGYFDDVTYNGYTVSNEVVTSQVILKIKGGDK
ncbi:MAG: pilus assembly protein PilM [Oscillospiraceae bacterium]